MEEFMKPVNSGYIKLMKERYKWLLTKWKIKLKLIL
jgi:hypothetical protein